MCIDKDLKGWIQAQIWRVLHLALGFSAGVRTWCGDIVDLPAYMGPVDAIFMNSMFGNMYEPDAALLHCALLLKPGGKIVISHPRGRAWQTQLHHKHPHTVPHPLPDRTGLESMLHGLPLRLAEWTDEEGLYCAVAQVWTTLFLDWC